jgi:hypothetical protein
MLNLHSGFWAVKNKTRMAKISIPVNPRDLRVVLQSSLERVPSARIPGLLRTLEKIALQTTYGGGFEIGVNPLQFVDGQWEVHPKNDDLHKESVVMSVLHGVEKKALIALHSDLFGQLFNANGHPQAAPANRSTEDKKARGEPVDLPVSAAQKRPVVAGAAGARVGSVSLTVQPPAQDGRTVGTIGDDLAPVAASRSQEKRITISERNLLLAIKGALDGLQFEDLLALNRLVLDAVDALKSRASRPALKAAKRLVWLEGGLNIEIENEEPTAVSLVRGLVAGLGFGALMQLHGEFSSRMNVAHAGARKAAANGIKAL